MLSQIEGDPDIVLWNGFVGDYQDISKELVEGELVKRTLSDYLQHFELDYARKAGDWNLRLTPEETVELKKNYKRIAKWELNDYVTVEDIAENRYTAKKIVFLQPKERGEVTIDRMGTIRY